MKDDPIASNEYLAVKAALRVFRYSDGRPVDPHERNLIEEILQLGEKYKANGYWIAAELDKMLAQVARMPQTAPSHSNWFLATIEARLQRRTHAERLNLTTAPSPEAAEVIGAMMAVVGLPGSQTPSTAEIRARQFLKWANGNRFQAVQDCIAEIKGSGQSAGADLMQTALWMIHAGWGAVEFQKKAPVVEFGQRDERKKA